MYGQFSKTDKVATFSVGIISLVGLYIASRYNYLLFHCISEVFSIVIAFGIFMFSWNSHRIVKNSYLQLLGITYLFVAGFDFLHTVAYKGMNLFQGGSTSNLASQLWIAARYMESISLFITPFFFRRNLLLRRAFSIYVIVFFLTIVSIFYWRIFPDCYIDGKGLTTFKIVSEYCISFILVAAIIHFLRHRASISERVFGYIVAALLLTIMSEMAFTLYTDVYGTFNLIGHYFKIISFYLIYKATVETGMLRPYSLLFLNLKKNEEALHKAHQRLEERVIERTSELRQSEQRYRTLIEASPDAIALLDSDNMIRMANQQALDLLGFVKPSELIGKSVFDFIFPSDEAPSRIDFRDELRKKPLQHLQFSMRRNDGTIIPIEMSVSGNTNGDGDFHSYILIARDISRRKKRDEELLHYQQQLQSLASELAISEERERRRIATGLHDHIGQILAVSRMKLGSVIPSISEEKERKDLEEVNVLLKQVIGDTRSLIFELSPPVLYELGLSAALHWLAEKTMHQHHINVEIIDDRLNENLTDDLKALLFQSTRELVFNVLKHARASRISIRLETSDNIVGIQVSDNGIGCKIDNLKVNENTGYGLFNIRERINHFGGQFNIESKIGKGCSVSISVPMNFPITKLMGDIQ